MLCTLHHTRMYPAPGYGDGSVMLCRQCTAQDLRFSMLHDAGENDLRDWKSCMELAPLFIVASTDDGREWAATGHPLDTKHLEEVTCHRHEH